MKTSLILFKCVEDRLSAEYVSQVVDCFYNGGINLDVVDVLPVDDDIAFRRRLEEYKDTADNLIVLVPEQIRFDVKKIISLVTDSIFIENENAQNFIKAISVQNGVSYSNEYAQMPIDATLIPNLNGPMQGFMQEDNEFTLLVLPMALEQLKPMCMQYVSPYFETKSGKKPYRLVLKYFGDENVLKSGLEELLAPFDNKVKANVTTVHGDSLLSLIFTPDTDRKVSDEIVRQIILKYQSNIYAEFETSLSERLFDLLQLKNKKISVAESFTGGRVVAEIIKNPGVSSYLSEGLVTYSNNSKVERLKVKAEDLLKHGAVSSNVAYQMALGLLNKRDTDIAIATTGIAGPKSDDTLKPVGLCYIAVGMKDGIHVYKYNFNGNREEITETAKNTALFLAIKKLKNI